MGLIIIPSNWGTAPSQMAALNDPRANLTGVHYVGPLASNTTEDETEKTNTENNSYLIPDPPPSSSC